jgi:hypothetical protein
LIATEVASPLQSTQHPPPDALRDFMAGKLSWEDTKKVVRHLLAGCRRCSRVTRLLWDFADEELDLTPEEEPHDS